MKGKWKIVIAVSALLVGGLLVWLVFFCNIAPRLSPWMKNRVFNEYYEDWYDANAEACMEWPLIWYDENGQVEGNYVWRYIGTYGDCHAFLNIFDFTNKILLSESFPPYRLEGFPRSVYYHLESNVVLYHTKRVFADQEARGFEQNDGKCRMLRLQEIKNMEDWLTDSQLEELAKDIEAISKCK